MQTARGTSVAEPDAAPGRALPRRVGTLVLTAVGVLAVDQVSKALVVATLSRRAPVRLLFGALQLEVVRNPGAAFGIAGGATVLFTAVAVGVVVAIVRTARRLRSTAWAAVLGLLLGGATGNLVDRLVRSPAPFRGRVVDWIDFRVWPVFNLADSAIVVGGVLAVVLAMRGEPLAGQPDPVAQPGGLAGAGDAGPREE